MKTIAPKTIAAAAALLALAAGCSQKAADPGPPISMKMKWTVGKTYDELLSMTQKSVTSAPGSGESMDQAMNMTAEFSLTASKARPAGGSELQMLFTNMKMETKMGATSLSFDSRQDAKNDAGNPMAPMLRKMIGAHISYLTDADGKVDQIVGYQEFIDQIAGDNAAMGAMVKSMYSEDSLKQMGVNAQGLPDKPVKIGDSWPFHQDIPAGPAGTLQLDMTVTFKGWEEHAGHHCAVLESRGQLKSKPGGGNSAMSVVVDKGTSEGTMWFDPGLGNVVDNVVDQTMNFKMQIQGQDVTSKLSQRVKMQLVKLSDAGK